MFSREFIVEGLVSSWACYLAGGVGWGVDRVVYVALAVWNSM